MSSPSEQNGHSTAAEELVAYLDGELDDVGTQQVERRLASDPAVREEIHQLERAWDLLDDLPREEADESFTQSTVEMVALQAEEALEAELARRPRRKVVQWLLAAACLGLAGFLGAFAAGWTIPHPDDALLRDLPALQRLDQLQQADNVEFLRTLRDEGRFLNEPVE